jgi:hypothetical protein
MGDRGMIEASHNVHKSIDFSDMSQELVAEAFALACTFDEAGDVKEFNGGRNNFGRSDDISNFVQPFIRDLYNPYVGINGTKGIICDLCTCRGQGVEDGGFPNIRKPDNAALKTHIILLY